ncbi:chemotaxis response regulator protein-glutamate methylesterase of group 1 operon [Marinobacterium zhoushanense]|uniref:Protein-glutamate methylesterase/protein-glutamine glutaminase n=1 Tax=Marinobacterium zhoushanense TaxID=1679163 RepID=A0ABQ1KV00_9GAMM|nr:chemotaxis response regulator protein-glutamate methylesterase [Marinobacterium zhoushanense]GGC07196.1 chemotaxis response regulator protein-glutamate methylesterase of group 1 operon [Marinobacterium zhoushanense]
MAIKVLIVDDSGFFRHRIEEILREDKRIEVVGSAVNGKEAVEKARTLKPDVITMDVEMPQLNGIDAVRIIMRECPTNVLMLSSLTHEGARITLEAMDAGAADYLPKDIRAWMDKSQGIRQQLIERILALGASRRFRSGSVFDHRHPSSRASGSSTMVFRPESTTVSRTASAREATPAARRRPLTAGLAEREPVRTATSPALRPRTTGEEKDPPTSHPSKVRFPDCRIVVIGTSTGGPAALQRILTQIPANFPYPILLVQHMPKTFTQVFAERLNQQCQISVKEAEDGDRLKPGLALLAPGGLQMMIDPRQADRVRVLEGDVKLTYKPSVDVTYASAARAYGARVLALILTGMGADGCDGARLLKREGATIWAQNRISCTIYGMPQAVVNAGLADEVLDLEDIGPLLAQQRRRG